MTSKVARMHWYAEEPKFGAFVRSHLLVLGNVIAALK